MKEKRQKKLVVFSLYAGLIGGMAMTVPLGMAVGSFTSAVLNQRTVTDPPKNKSGSNDDTTRSPAFPAHPPKRPETTLSSRDGEQKAHNTGKAETTRKEQKTTPKKQRIRTQDFWDGWQPNALVSAMSGWPETAQHDGNIPYAPAASIDDGADEIGESFSYDWRKNRYASGKPNFTQLNDDLDFLYSGDASFCSSGGSIRKGNENFNVAPLPANRPTPTPIPSAVYLFCSGLFAVVGLRHTRKSNR